MTDLWLLVLAIGFFGVCVLYVVFCDRIIGPDDEAVVGDADVGGDAQEESVGAAIR